MSREYWKFQHKICGSQIFLSFQRERDSLSAVHYMAQYTPSTVNARMDDEDFHQNLVLVMGLTGAGKTYFINRLTGENLQVGQKLVSCN